MENIEREVTFNYNNEDYALLFNLNVMEEIQEEYGTIEKWGELTEANGKEPNAKAIKFGLGAMINEGIDVYNETHEEKRPFFTPKQIGRIITEVGLNNIAATMQKTVIESTKSDEKNS